MDLDLGAVRTLLAVVDDGQFTVAAARLGMTQQAVSKRIARLESELGVPLLVRSRTGVAPTEAGAAFLPQARALVGLADQAVAALRADRRPLRVDALAKASAPIEIVRDFYETAEVELDVVVSRGTVPRERALADGSIDAAFGRVTGPLPPGIMRVPACLEPIPVMVGRRHALARRKRVALKELDGLTAWMPGNARDSEWSEFYRFLSDEVGVLIDTSGPVFGADHLMERVAGSAELITFANQTQFPGYPDVVQIDVTDPAPAYPWSLMWHEDNRHPSLPLLIDHVRDHYRPSGTEGFWIPGPDRPLFP
ncbi:LysR family transcriptional regulator [Actinomadura rupiterrae]|uniref:LysR family transcriptional regulator n=1 Tax=Actinomadura rupiterrae TaxID=559627 RepID=UPI0020A43600|nr:LysR family transcriptional regulator [Actinomadura rupiterrae]MCP2342843.1 DNA-binding transcriptional LysR family regulator [Actinomadura rupiterrae]